MIYDVRKRESISSVVAVIAALSLFFLVRSVLACFPEQTYARSLVVRVVPISRASIPGIPRFWNVSDQWVTDEFGMPVDYGTGSSIPTYPHAVYVERNL